MYKLGLRQGPVLGNSVLDERADRIVTAVCDGISAKGIATAEAGDGAGNRKRDTLSLGASIVLYRTPVREIFPLVEQFLDQGTQVVYLVDNSPKGFDAFRGWAPPDRVVTISTRTNLGYGRANNLAIRDSVRRHKYHVVCNPDIALGPNILTQLYNLLETRTDVGLCGPRVIGTDGQLHYLCKRAPSLMDLAVRRFAPETWFPERRFRYEMRDYSYEEEMEPTFISGCFMFFRSAVLDRLDGFDERFFLYMEDVDLSRRAQELARNLYYPRNHVVHAHHGGAHKSLRLLLHFGASVLRYFDKWGWFDPHAGNTVVRRPRGGNLEHGTQT
jgi:GT2 family glycosyltransferase